MAPPNPEPSPTHAARARPVLVTGATGNAGREVVRALRSRGAAVRLAARVADAPDEVRLDFQDASTFAAAAQSCGAVFLLRPPAISDVGATLLPFVDAARAEGVEHIVFLSVAGAERNPLVPHHAVERHLQGGPPGWTLLRPGFFAQNVGTAYREDIVRDDRVYVPAGRGRAAFVDLRDVGDVAADALLHPEAHRGQAYTLTGPRAFSFAEVAWALTQATGRAIRYDAASALGYAAHLVRQGAPLAQAAVQTVLHVGLRFGQAQAIDPTLERLLGRRPRSVLDYIRDHASLWT